MSPGVPDWEKAHVSLGYSRRWALLSLHRRQGSSSLASAGPVSMLSPGTEAGI